MKRAQPSSKGPSALAAALEFREVGEGGGEHNDQDVDEDEDVDEEVELVQAGLASGGRGKKNVLCAEVDAGKTVYQFFSFKDEDGGALADGMMRCILYHGPRVPAIIARPKNGGTRPFLRHMELVHGFVPTTAAAPVKAATGAPPAKKQTTGPLARFLTPTARPSAQMLSDVAFKFIIKAKQPFSTVMNPAFVGFVQDLFMLLGADPALVKFVHATTIGEWVTRDAALARDIIKTWWKTNIYEGWFSLTNDLKKAVYKGVPLMDIVLHCGVMTPGNLASYHVVSIVVLIGVCSNKDTDTRKLMIESTVRSYGLKMANMLLYVADQGEESVSRVLERKAGTAVPFLADPAHRVSNAVETAAKAAGLLRRHSTDPPELFDKVNDITRAIVNKYAARVEFNMEREKAENLVDGQPKAQLIAYTRTRFISELLSSHRLSLNEGAIRAVTATALEQNADLGRKSNLFKFVTEYEADYDDMFRQLHEVGTGSAFFNDAIVRFSGAHYPLLSQLVPSIFMLQLQCRYAADEGKKNGFTPKVVLFFEELCSDLARRFANDLDNWVVAAAVATDVRFRNFDPGVFPPLRPDDAGGALTKMQFKFLHEKYGGKIFNNTVQLYYQLYPQEWTDELAEGGALSKAVDPVNQQRRGLDGTKDFLRQSRFGKELLSFFAAERASLKDGKGSVTFKTDPVAWLKLCSSSARVVRLGLVVAAAPASEISCERLWKELDDVVTKSRAKISVERSADTVFLNKVWKMAEKEPALESLRPVKVKKAGAATGK